jgi:hypothetical protein
MHRFIIPFCYRLSISQCEESGLGIALEHIGRKGKRNEKQEKPPCALTWKIQKTVNVCNKQDTATLMVSTWATSQLRGSRSVIG